MKIRVDFVTNSSSSSFVAINFRRQMTLQKYLKKSQIDKSGVYSSIIKEYEEKWKLSNAETKESYAIGLCTYLKNHLESENVCSLSLDKKVVEELVQFIWENKQTIDLELQQRMKNESSTKDSDTLLDTYLKEHGLSSIFSKIEYEYGDWQYLEAELQESFALSLCEIIERCMDESYRFEDKFDVKAVEKLIQFLRENKETIDYEIEGEIELRASDGEDGFAYAQCLNYQNHQGTLKKWPCSNGWNSGYREITEFGERMCNGEIEELLELPYDVIWELVWQDKDLEVAIEKTGDIKKFDIPLPISENHNE